MSVAVFKKGLMVNHYRLIEQLENKYNDYIKKLLQQKKMIIIELQNSLFQQFVHMQKKEDDLRNEQKKKNDLRNQQKKHQQISNRFVPDLEPIETSVDDRRTQIAINKQAPNIDSTIKDKVPIFSLKDVDPNKSIESEAKSDHSRFKGSKPFSCNYCIYQTYRKEDWKRHTRIHVGDKPYKCNYCNYRAGRKDMLRRHIMSHTGEKRCRCVYCGKRFRENCDLNRHITILKGKSGKWKQR